MYPCNSLNSKLKTVNNIHVLCIHEHKRVHLKERNAHHNDNMLMILQQEALLESEKLLNISICSFYCIILNLQLL